MNNNLYMSTLLKAFDILDCFDDDRQEIGISDISAKVGLPVSSVHRIIQSLEFEGMLSQNQESKKYALGSKMLAFSRKCGQYQRYQQIAAKYVDELCRVTEENVNLAICSGDQITNIYTAETHFVLRPNFPLYQPFPAHCTGTGRVFLSHMSEAAQKWVYENNADAIGMSQEEFLACCARPERTAMPGTIRPSTRACAAWPRPSIWAAASCCSPCPSPPPPPEWTTPPTKTPASWC